MEKPILFNTEMVKAILDGRKTMTRRIIKQKYENTYIKWFTNKYGTRLVEMQNNVEGETFGKNTDGTSWQKILGYREINPPYQPGDILWVRETFAIGKIDCGEEPDGTAVPYISQCKGESNFIPKEYALREGIGIDDVVWKPSIHMPRKAARLFLRVKNVRAERLQDITEEDARAEGFEPLLCSCGGQAYACTDCYNTGMLEPAELSFLQTWDSIYSKRSLGWEANPWVWVIEFERVKGA